MTAPAPAPRSSPNPLWQLTLARLRALSREPSVIFWSFGLPLLTSIALGAAFTNKPPDKLNVVVAEGPRSAAIAEGLRTSEGLTASVVPLAEAKDLLRRGAAAVAVVPGEPTELLLDPTRPDSLNGKLLVKDALERAAGREDRLGFVERPTTAPGSRYIDFLIPGLLGMGMLFSAMWGLGWTVVEMRVGKLLKRLAATPMRRSHFLLSLAFSRAVLALAEITFVLLFARLLFDVRMFGSYLEFVAFSLLGMMSLCGLAVLAASRARNVQTAGGVMNVMTLPMTVLSGVFFSSSNFPDWAEPLIKALPLTALLDGMRAIMLDGASVTSLWKETAILLAWGLIPGAIAVRVFRWR